MNQCQTDEHLSGLRLSLQLCYLFTELSLREQRRLFVSARLSLLLNTALIQQIEELHVCLYVMCKPKRKVILVNELS